MLKRESGLWPGALIVGPYTRSSFVPSGLTKLIFPRICFWISEMLFPAVTVYGRCVGDKEVNIL